MLYTNSLWAYFANAGFVLKFVMLFLLAASIFSWMLILQRGYLLWQVKRAIKNFEEQFRDSNNLVKFYQETGKAFAANPLGIVFTAGFKEFWRLRKQQFDRTELLASCERVMRHKSATQVESLENNLPLLATIGSVSPYMGLFGTVWGIMTAFHALGNVQQATISMVAPGISEALLATALGLFAAIPAVLAYNRYSYLIEKISATYENFQDELLAILNRTQDQTDKQDAT